MQERIAKYAAVFLTFFVFANLSYTQSSAPKPEHPRFTEPARNYDLQNLRLELRIDIDQKSFSGKAINRLVPLFDGVERIRFDAVNLQIESVTLNGKSLPYSPFEDGVRKGIEIELGRSYSEKDNLSIEIKYSGKDPEKGLYFIQPTPENPSKPYQVWSQGQDMDNRYWIPTYDYPNDRTSTEFFFTLREPMNAVSNGTLLKTTPAGESEGKKWNTFHWKMDQPYSTYLIAIAAADWEKYSDTVSLPGRSTPLAVDYYVNRGVGEATARRSYSETPKMIEFFSKKIGVPFPWDKYGQATVTDFVVGGMENVSITLNTDRTLHDERAHLDQSSRGLVAHELAHQWWGDYLTCRNWAELWLNEGFATYFECLWTREIEGEDAFRVALRRNQQSARGSDPKDNPRPLVETFVDPQSDGSGNAIYVKGASVLYMLHRLLGEELWWKAINHYANKHALGLVDTHDFEIAIREATGKNLDWFFQQYAYMAGYPEFEVSHDWSPETRQSKLSVKQTQKVEGLRPLFRMPIDIGITTANGTQKFTVICDSPEQNFYFPVEHQPLMVRFDRDSWVYKTVKFDLPVDMLQYQLRNDPDVIGRIEAAEALAEKKSDAEKIAPSLEQALRDERVHSVRSACAVALGKLGSGLAKDSLLAGLRDEKSSVRRNSVEALAQFKEDASVFDALAKTFREDKSYATQSAALSALTKVDKNRSAEFVLEALTMASFRDQIASTAIGLLAEMKEQNPAEKIKEFLNASYSVEIQRSAASALAKIGKEKPEKERGDIVEAVLQYAERHGVGNRSGIIQTLSSLGDKRAIPFLEKIANGNARRNQKEAAQRAIEQLRGEKKEEKKPGPSDAESLKKEIERLKQQIDSIEKRVPVTSQ